VLLDGAQSVSHTHIDVQAPDCDFFVFSGHKVFGPTGIGVVYGKPNILEHMPPWPGGGNMIQDVTFENPLPGPSAALRSGHRQHRRRGRSRRSHRLLDRVGMHNVSRHEHPLLVYADRLSILTASNASATCPLNLHEMRVGKLRIAVILPPSFH
jgi:cysteine desulfurase/selenocysteine lyase